MWRGVAPLPIRVCGVVCCPVAVLACFVCRVCVCSVPTQIILIGFMSNIPCRRPPRERPTRPRRAGPGPNSSRHFTHSIQIHTQTQARRASSKLLFHTCCARTVRQTLHFTQIYVFIYPPSPLLPPSPHARLTSGSGGNHGVAVAVRASQLTLQLTWQKDGSIALGTLSALP